MPKILHFSITGRLFVPTGATVTHCGDLDTVTLPDGTMLKCWPVIERDGEADIPTDEHDAYGVSLDPLSFSVDMVETMPDSPSTH